MVAVVVVTVCVLGFFLPLSLFYKYEIRDFTYYRILLFCCLTSRSLGDPMRMLLRSDIISLSAGPSRWLSKFSSGNMASITV